MIFLFYFLESATHMHLDKKNLLPELIQNLLESRNGKERCLGVIGLGFVLKSRISLGACVNENKHVDSNTANEIINNIEISAAYTSLSLELQARAMDLLKLILSFPKQLRTLLYLQLSNVVDRSLYLHSCFPKTKWNQCYGLTEESMDVIEDLLCTRMRRYTVRTRHIELDAGTQSTLSNERWCLLPSHCFLPLSASVVRNEQGAQYSKIQAFEPQIHLRG